VGLGEKLFDLIRWDGKGDACCHLQGIDSNHLTILKSKAEMVLRHYEEEAGACWESGGPE
jgi:hypothetical protein